MIDDAGPRAPAVQRTAHDPAVGPGTRMISSRKSALRLAAGVAAKSGLLRLACQLRRSRGEHRVFIVEYHEVAASAEEPEGTVGGERFRRHLRYLKRHFRLVALSEAVGLLAKPGELTEDLVVVTLDDGYAGNYEVAWPVLRAEGVSATLFVATGFLDGAELWFDIARRSLASVRSSDLPVPLQRELTTVLGAWPFTQDVETAVQRLKPLSPGERDGLLVRLRAACLALPPPAQPLRWDQVREMHAAGIEIGCHTVSHPTLSTLAPARQEEEIVRARERIAAETGEAPTFFAYPNGGAGDFNTATLEILRRTGFTAACTTIRGSNRPGCDPLRLRRIGVGADTEALLAARLAGVFDEAVRAYLPGHA